MQLADNNCDMFGDDLEMVAIGREKVKTGVSGARFPKKPGRTTLVPRDTSLGRLTVDVNAHKSGTARHGSPPDQTTKGMHRPVSLTRN
ncbi:hypothetical protein PHYBLDRAFT_152749 [Phycomyces blakesleeanus NRRL 1555(-)]|uniref:Uncharacterized protein n=1 Tax=Phycomyces blakesleeanus (strain ATCC 8743b / DSM 1359 / FGSC 10004 / NBRC 33097 / NRRL 1555) TaxID=763407 RepID=A0A163CWU4_PHYB8|nr:hypothetical protein PHYBLDRAFT_152749 [Phycomyces blakesleeanus NRRL 1555(-)]OAD66180.1 hypothetical protein PHYBLDRAFT_152749 [Phycomyces blakesleeanus NRRL 1555(-)]|eukprot:XP_018284220.1 hypothetical protein PHYBLDRAFT_152749 [Phycomyces blakesleeanus NRRL 1555(-)]